MTPSPDTADDLRFQAEAVVVDAFNLIEQDGRCGPSFAMENGPLRRAEIPDAHPRPDAERQEASAMA
ncbi:hypothetical protein DSCA_29680 [Desulfosarcina alkanivorans]|uniref:Uncharacterized protein n=1 Tax=Desulfosarcina alkanivorans TaxID=571177 RepID=A0A5K7YJJ3_9BACT|nr:hypothetical protein DSCA_29680 [Desulfosarcina alkanivorans]